VRLSMKAAAEEDAQKATSAPPMGIAE